jgi:polar amino acid transport system substrate-binding protein
MFRLLLLTCQFCLVLKGHSQELKIMAVDEPPAAFIGHDNAPKGYVYDIVKAMQQVTHNKTDIIFVPEARALNMLAQEPNAMLLGISRIPSREQHYFWIAQVMFKKWEVYVPAKSDIAINTIDDLRGLTRIGVVRGDVREEWLIDHYFTNLNSVTLHEQNIQMLDLGRVSAIVYDKQGMVFQTEALGLAIDEFRSVFTLNRAPVYIVMSKLSPMTIVAEWQNAFNTISINGELLAISKRWQASLLKLYKLDSDIQNNILVF